MSKADRDPAPRPPDPEPQPGDRLMPIFRRIMTAHGTVQGVGFRPFVYQRAAALGLSGSVHNCSQGVLIDVEGERAALDALQRDLTQQAPPLARVVRLEVQDAAPRGVLGFRIVASQTAGARAAWPPADVAPCSACRRELTDPADRRYLYPFTNCTACGPRFTIVRALPYDRARTTMASFPLCPDCHAEYEDPRSRRFHAEPNACARCGPHLYYEGRGASAQTSAIAACVAALRRGEIVAIKGVGGFHLACDARSAKAVERLRERKRRVARPLALMAADLDGVTAFAVASAAEQQSLSAKTRPIVLLARRPFADSLLAPGIAPGLRELGFMLPPSPLHQILADTFAGPLVMTSGNLAEEPLARENDEARQRLGAVADAFLVHDREIVSRIDDSILRVEDGREHLLRRARGYVPEPLPLATTRPVLAVGADLKNTFCLAAGGLAFVSQHLGDLASPEARTAWREARATFSTLLGWEPEVVACDLHPDYASTRLAESLRLPLFRVQHHHAHAAACLAEYEHPGPAIAVVFDGAGYGEDGAVWGGEFLIADCRRAIRAAHLRYVRLPGGDLAARQPWRMALSYLADAGEPLAACQSPWPQQVALLHQAMQRGVASPWTSSAGRLFDAVSALCGLCAMGQFEGQAAMLLEAQSGAQDESPYPFHCNGQAPVELDLRPTIAAIAADLRAGRPAAEIGARFHNTLAALVEQTAAALAREHQLDTVLLSGGCFQNARLSAACTARLRARGLTVLRPARFPPNDGGISLGQAAVAAARMKE